MGADLYIKSISDRAQKKYRDAFDSMVRDRDAAKTEEDKERRQREVNRLHHLMYPPEGYFRDAYNATSISRQLGFSWWQDVAPMLTKNSCLMPAKVKELLDRIVNVEIPVPTAEELKAAHCKVDDGENSPEAWHQSFVDHKQRLVAFLGNAIDRNEKIYCSL